MRVIHVYLLGDFIVTYHERLREFLKRGIFLIPIKAYIDHMFARIIKVWCMGVITPFTV